MLIFPLVNMVEALRTGKIAVKREITWNVAITYPIDKLAEQHSMVFEQFTRLFTLLAFLEAAKLQWVVFTALADIVGEQVVGERKKPWGARPWG